MGSDPLREIVITEVGYTLTSKNNTTLVSDAAPLCEICPWSDFKRKHSDPQRPLSWAKENLHYHLAARDLTSSLHVLSARGHED